MKIVTRLNGLSGLRRLAAGFAALAACALALSCSPAAAQADQRGGVEKAAAPAAQRNRAELDAQLRELAWLERSRGFQAGLGLRESSLRELCGDWAGAVFAAWKELSWAWSLGALEEAELGTRLAALRARMDAEPRLGAEALDELEAALQLIDASRAEDWAAVLSALQPPALQPPAANDAETDSWRQYLLLSAMLETGRASDWDRSRFAVLALRYGSFPEYWLRAARYARAPREAMDCAERCVALAPQGPCAQEARSLLAAWCGLDTASAADLLVSAEIEACIRDSDLERLYPTLALPDNPFTLYALGLLRSLAADASLRETLLLAANAKSGRLSERLRYAAGV